MSQPSAAIHGTSSAFSNTPPRPCATCARAARRRDPLDRKCIRPGADNDDRNRALNPYYGPGHADKFLFRLRKGTKHEVYDDALNGRGTAALPRVRVNYGMRRKIGTGTYVYCFGVLLDPSSAGRGVSGWIDVQSFEAVEANYLRSARFKVCKFGSTPPARDCKWKVSGNRPAWSYLKVTPFRPPKGPRRDPRPTDTRAVKKRLERLKAARDRWIRDYDKHMKAGDYLATDDHVNVCYSLPGNGGKSLGTVPVGTIFCRSGARKPVALYKRRGTKKVATMWFVFGHYQAGGRKVKGWIAEKALRPR
ncbi:MAG TPA: hypothetical protein VGB85_17025 [Nannocystis sp.]|jgi:hypothetical protein